MVGKPSRRCTKAWRKAGFRASGLTLTDPTVAARSFSAPEGRPFEHLCGGQLNFLDRVFIAVPGPDQAVAYLYGLRANDPQAWFYACHFAQDPVMPGSLGVEAIFEAIQLYALHAGLGKPFRSPRFGLPVDRPISWKYRGQILPSQRQMKLEVQVVGVEKTPGQVIILANASLWADAARIYEVKNATVSLDEAG